MEVVGILGFIFGLAALVQVTLLKKDVEKLKMSTQKLGGELDSESNSD